MERRKFLTAAAVIPILAAGQRAAKATEQAEPVDDQIQRHIDEIVGLLMEAAPDGAEMTGFYMTFRNGEVSKPGGTARRF